MAHYVAGCLVQAQAAKGKAKSELERESFAMILRLWEHRRALPGPPLRNFDPILELLGTLSDPHRYWYFDEAKIQAEEDVKKWVVAAKNVDIGARSMVSWCLSKASLQAALQEGRWLGNLVINLTDSGESKTLRTLITQARRRGGVEVDPDDEIRKDLEQMRERFLAFEATSRSMAKEVSATLSNLRKEARSTRPKKAVAEFHPRRGARNHLKGS